MTVTAHVYGLALTSMLNAQINYPSATVRGMLVTSAYSPNQDTHRWKSDVTGEAVGTGYTARGLALTSKTVAYSAGSNTTSLDCADFVWAAATVQARYLVIYVDTGTDSTSPLISWVDFGADVTSTGGSFTATVPVAGFAQFAAS
jgi:hypothetical protein